MLMPDEVLDPPWKWKKDPNKLRELMFIISNLLRVCRKFDVKLKMYIVHKVV